MNMPGFNVQASRPATPFQMLSPEVLAQLAAAGFRPPPPAGAPGLPSMGGGAPGFGMGDGMGVLGMGLSALDGMGGGNPFMAAERTAGDRDLSGYGSSPVDPMGGNPNAQPVEVFNPTGKRGGFGAFLDFLTGR